MKWRKRLYKTGVVVTVRISADRIVGGKTNHTMAFKGPWVATSNHQKMDQRACEWGERGISVGLLLVQGFTESLLGDNARVIFGRGSWEREEKRGNRGKSAPAARGRGGDGHLLKKSRSATREVRAFGASAEKLEKEIRLMFRFRSKARSAGLAKEVKEGCELKSRRRDWGAAERGTMGTLQGSITADSREFVRTKAMKRIEGIEGSMGRRLSTSDPQEGGNSP